jgi:transcriptional regulator with XRE-family HTH domain
LRREELAQLAGVGTTWYTWLEQGRKIRASAGVLDSIARTLRLDADERAYLFTLAREEAPIVPLPTTPAISDAVQQVIDAISTYPCYVMDARWNVVAWNRAACAVLGEFASLSGRDRNIVWRMFTAKAQRELLVNWEYEAQTVLALFRSSTSRYVGEPWYTEMVADLTKISPEFATWWSHAELRGIYAGRKELEHPAVGRLVFQPVTLLVADAPDLRLLAFPPLPGTDTEQKVQRLLCMFSEPGEHDGSRSDAKPRVAEDGHGQRDTDRVTSLARLPVG